MIALVTATLGACSSEDNEPVPQQPATQQPSTQQARPLTISVSETPFINPDDQSGGRGTRAAITTTSTLSAFKMDYVYEYIGETTELYTNGSALKASKDGEGEWKMTEGVWPDVSNDKTVYWYAYTNNGYGSVSFNKGSDLFGAYLSFSVYGTPADQNDLLVANISDTWAHSGGNLSLTFDHACAALRFFVKKSTNLNAYTLSVTNIALCNVKNGGRYYFSTSSWSNLSGAASYTLFTGSSKTLPSNEYEELSQGLAGPYLFLIPQELTAWNATGSPSDTYLAITCTITRISDSQIMYNDVAYIPFGYTLEKGTQYDVNINIGKSSLYNSDGNLIIN